MPLWLILKMASSANFFFLFFFLLHEIVLINSHFERNQKGAFNDFDNLQTFRLISRHFHLENAKKPSENVLRTHRHSYIDTGANIKAYLFIV